VNQQKRDAGSLELTGRKTLTKSHAFLASGYASMPTQHDVGGEAKLSTNLIRCVAAIGAGFWR
jgi:hypothetical protein